MNDSEEKVVTDIHGNAYKPAAVLILALLAAFAGAIMQTSLGTALPILMRDFNVNLNTAQQATTWFLLANGVMIPISAFLANRFPTRWLQIASYALMLVGTLMSALTPERNSAWTFFLIGRVLAAIAVGIIFPLMQIVILNMFSRKRTPIALGLSGLVVGMAPAIGPTLSGWILNKPHVIFGLTLSNSWRMIFIVPIVVTTLVLLVSPFILKDVIPNRPVKLDVLSLLLSIVGFGAFLLGFTNVSDYGWGSLAAVIFPIVLGVILLLLFTWRQLKQKAPFLDIRVFKTRNFSVASISILLVAMSMFGVELMLPTYLQNVHHLNPLDSGLTLLPGAILLGAMSPVAGYLYNKVGVRCLSIVGFSILAIGTLPFSFLNDATSTEMITALYTIRLLGIALVMMPLTTSALQALPKSKGTDGTAANNTLRQVSASIVVALLTSITQNEINQGTPSKAFQASDPLAFTKRVLDASMNGYRISFFVSFMFAVIGILFVIFLNNPKRGGDDS